MRSVVDNGIDAFREQLASLKALTGATNDEIGEMLGVTGQTICNAYKNPMAASGRIILIVQERLRREHEKRRYT